MHVPFGHGNRLLQGFVVGFSESLDSDISELKAISEVLDFEPVLNEEQLTTELSLSRTPVRDALGRLEQEGLLEIRPKCGILVRPLTLNDIDMIFEVRMMYEPYVLTHYGANLSVSALNEFYDIFKKWDPNKEIYRDKDSFYDLDYRFHALIMSACPNEFINRSYDTIQTQNERFRYMTGNVSNFRLEATFKEHMAIVEPCLKGDWEKAKEQLIYHLEQSKASHSVLSLLPRPTTSHII